MKQQLGMLGVVALAIFAVSQPPSSASPSHSVGVTPAPPSVGRVAPIDTSLLNGIAVPTGAMLGKSPFIQVFALPVSNPQIIDTSISPANASDTPPVLGASQTSSMVYGFAPAQAGAVAVDRAGFVRFIQRLRAASRPTSSEVSSLIDEARRSLKASVANPTVGQTAPDFVVSDMNGQRRRLSDLRGRKNVLLTYFPQCFTFNCANQLASLRDSSNDLKAADVEVWGISVDPASGFRGQQAFARHLNLPFPLIPDEGRNLCLLFGAVQSPLQMATRMSVLVDKEGKVRWIDKQMSPRTHGPDVLAKIKELGMLPSEVPKN